MLELTRYIAFGDSMSIDLYPALDAGATDVAVALERVATAGFVAPLGAASLLFKNSEEQWPDEIGRDLSSLYPGLTFENVATDDASIGDVFGEQLPSVIETDEPTLLTLTIGGNDLLSAYGSRPRKSLLARIEADIADAYDLLVDTLRGRFPNGVLVLSTIYDPSDRTGKIPGISEELGQLPLGALDALNAHIRTLASGTAHVVLAEVYGAFLGHGVTAPENEQWYWRRSPVEPNARGASEIRRVWLDALERAGYIG